MLVWQPFRFRLDPLPVPEDGWHSRRGGLVEYLPGRHVVGLPGLPTEHAPEQPAGGGFRDTRHGADDDL